ncbi:hypothetical protein Droror1_Dr00011172 [Drosera rotundifolia]
MSHVVVFWAPSWARVGRVKDWAKLLPKWVWGFRAVRVFGSCLRTKPLIETPSCRLAVQHHRRPHPRHPKPPVTPSQACNTAEDPRRRPNRRSLSSLPAVNAFFGPDFRSFADRLCSAVLGVGAFWGFGFVRVSAKVKVSAAAELQFQCPRRGDCSGLRSEIVWGD